MRFAIVVLILCLAAFTAHAISYSNDSDSIDIDYAGGSPVVDEVEDEPENGANNEEGSEENPSEPNDSSEEESEADSFNEESEDITIPVEVVGENGQNLSEGEGFGDDVEDILNTLLGNQALFFGGGHGSGNSESITLSGEKLRAALKARGIGALSIADLLGRRFQSKKDFALVAASSLLENKTIEEVILTLDALSLTYKSEGRLFAVFPLSYPVTVTITPYAATREERIQVKFPWYRFFLQTFVSRAELQREIDAAIVAIIEGGMESIDAKTELFIAVANVIEVRFDTVQGTLQ